MMRGREPEIESTYLGESQDLYPSREVVICILSHERCKLRRFIGNQKQHLAGASPNTKKANDFAVTHWVIERVLAGRRVQTDV